MQLVNQTQNLESSYHPLQKTLLNFPQITISQCHMGHIQSHFQNYTNSKNLHSTTEQSTTMQYKTTWHIIQTLFGHTFKNNIVTISVHKTSKSFQTFSAISQKWQILIQHIPGHSAFQQKPITPHMTHLWKAYDP